MLKATISYLKQLQTFTYVTYRLKDLFIAIKFNISKRVIDSYWEQRIIDVCASSDNNNIKKVTNAGVLGYSYQIMHNGLKIFIGSYYGKGSAMYGMHEMLRLNKGIHEPQEEYVFQEVLKSLPEGAVMLELGSYWAFYSMWFNQVIKGAKNYLVEPDARSLYSGKRNFEINKLNGSFFQYYIGEESKELQYGKQVCVDDFLTSNQISTLDILHCDIQGFELEMLSGAKNSLSEKKIRYLFISTHSIELHYECKRTLLQYGYYIIAEADIVETFSFDGLIVACVNSLNPFEISKKVD